jgi:D-lactate dehydrogenase
VTELRKRLEQVLAPAQILDRPIDRAAYASDASFYTLVPQVVVRPRSIDDVRRIFRVSRDTGVPLTFRAAGTSLSGQAVTDGILVDLSRDWRFVEPLDDGHRVRVKPGIIGGHVNRALLPFGRRIGPDPASIDACMMGGILANNSSGMCCGTTQNAYKTIESLVYVLPSGTVVDTSHPHAGRLLWNAERDLVVGIEALRDRIAATPRLAERIRHKYRMKNTMGYSLNAFVDFERPIEIFSHLLIGSEGTLAFIAEAVLRTVPDLPVKYTGLLLFPDIAASCRAIEPFAGAGAAALELMDRAALRSVEDVPGVPAALRTLPDEAAGLLVEFQAPAGQSLDALAAAASSVLGSLTLVEPARFTADPTEQALLWRVRKGMIPSVGATRRRGTTVLIEDVTFPVTALPTAVVELQQLFRKHDYPEGIIFGHAKDGNLHFLITQSFGDAAAIRQYEKFMDDVVDLVVKRYDGALKAEHGTGRNMAPFVETEWGAEAYDIMRQLKALADPDGLLNPGVIINPDPRAHVTNLKPLPEVEEEIDRCIECGFCESYCPSRALTLSPRQRIVVRRAMERNTFDRAVLRESFVYDALETCATDGLCAVGCPVKIDTGQLTKRFRAAEHSRTSHRIAAWTASHFALTEQGVRAAFRTAGIARSLLGSTAERLSGWLTAPLPRPASPMPSSNGSEADAVYFPSCVSRTIGPLSTDGTEASQAEAFVAVAARAGVRLRIPSGVHHRCCGMPYSSKGFREAHAIASNATIESLWEWSAHGELPIVVDTSPCTYALRSGDDLTPENRERLAHMRILDALEFFPLRVLPSLDVKRRASRVTVHPVCSVVKMGLTDRLRSVAQACSNEVLVPPSSGCCGFAGDRGWLVPELTASATRYAAEEVRACPSDGYYSSSRTCEIGMSRATGFTYKSWIHLLDWATRAEP